VDRNRAHRVQGPPRSRGGYLFFEGPQIAQNLQNAFLKPTEYAEHAEGLFLNELPSAQKAQKAHLEGGSILESCGNGGMNVAADVSQRKLGPGIVRRVTPAATCFCKNPQITQNTQNLLKADGARGSRRSCGVVTWTRSAAFRRRLRLYSKAHRTRRTRRRAFWN